MKAQRQETRQQIIRKGLQALYRKGYNATGVQEIVQSANIPKGSFYNYFKNKEDFAVACMQYFTTREVKTMQSVLSDLQHSPLDRVRVLYQKKIDYLSNTGRFSLGCLLCNMTLEMADVSEVIAEEASRCFEKEYQPMIACLNEAQTKGDISADADVTELVHLIRNCWLGALVMMKAEKTEKPLQDFTQQLEKILA